MNAERADRPVPDQHGIPGKTLAAQREAMGWTVEQVADQLKLAVRQVIALEEGDYANLPGPAVVRGFVRAYAKVVKLDAAPLVAQIALDTPAVNDSSASVVRRERPTSFSQVRFPTNGKRASKLPYLLVGAVVVLGAAAYGAWHSGLIPHTLLAGIGAPGTTPASVASAPLPAVATPAAPDGAVAVLPPPVAALPADSAQAAKPAEPLPPVISNAVPLISVPPPSTPSSSAAAAGALQGVNPQAGTAQGASPAPAAPAAAPVAAPAPASNALVLVVREDSWIEVRRDKGPKLFSGLVKGGRVETVTLDGPATLIVGNPGAVDATLRGQTVALPTNGSKTARVPLK
ncbi:helix-turn-helix domain-containing protein [Massilia sp. CF038]|uniref:helix-turn-helix domain-containing protein n=1 Tax=Massilia sp. CF038 TaxID=1881045 RepID=UPI0009196E51|nr:helix-turn-helix domain-containing protein [Massilia sp. CF038]SHG53631.1 cytoskeleton protein RodZ [Massilia sp. CF038]